MGLAQAGAPRDGGLSLPPGGEATAKVGEARDGIFLHQLPSASFETRGPNHVSTDGSHVRMDGSHTAGKDETPFIRRAGHPVRPQRPPPAFLPPAPIGRGQGPLCAW